MSTEHQLACDQCGFAVTTAARERQADGRMVTRRYCAACGTVREWDIGAHAEPRGPLGVPLGPRHSQAARVARGLAGRLRGAGQPAAVNCPVCGNDTLLVLQADQEPRCPQCGVGRIRERESR